MKPGALLAGRAKPFDSVILNHFSQQLPPYGKLQPSTWESIITKEKIQHALREVVTPAYVEMYAIICKGGQINTETKRLKIVGSAAQPLLKSSFEKRLQQESSLAGALLLLEKNKNYTELEKLFYKVKNSEERVQRLLKFMAAGNSADAYFNINTLNPSDKNDIRNVSLSPIGVVHLFRQYFFELDTFLGTPVSHVWLSPGSNVELIEVHTRKVIVEKTLETSFETISKSEKSITDQEEISEAVKEDNKQDIKFGASVTGSYGMVTASSSFNYNTTQQTAREDTHKRMRQQTEKLSSEIRKNYKSTFKTINETTDTSSKRYFLTNSGPDLMNYELRRKMRQVGVQVQDIGTYLCWQTYVDDPGADLGIAKLIHIAQPAELGAIPHPEEIPTFQEFKEEKMATIPFVSINDTDADKEGEVYANGNEVNDNEFAGELEQIQSDFELEYVCPKANYMLKSVEFDAQGKPLLVSMKGAITNESNKSKFMLHLDSVDFQGQDSVQVKLVLHWCPAQGANDEITKKNKENGDAFKAKEKLEFEKAYVENSKERVKLSHGIRPRKGEDLREEERIVVYRKLIQDMLLHGVHMPDDRSRHVVAELINSIFDVDKMLYFVAPEWWRPRLRRSIQQIPEAPQQSAVTQPDRGTPGPDKGHQRVIIEDANAAAVKSKPLKLPSSTVGWGGVDDERRDNYFITEDSEPAKLGSSLGWLLQLDGDNMRKAFMNAPWVKAVMPIRPGKEEAAINWLKGVEGMNGITDSDKYSANDPGEVDINGNPLDGQNLIDVLFDLAKKIKKKHQDGLRTSKWKEGELADPGLVDEGNTVTSTPIDRVYEHGFYPLKDGFKANVEGHYEIFDQWIEILPTDQVVPVEVKYNPKTGRQL